MSEVEGRNAEDVAPGFMDAPGGGLREGFLTYATGFVLAAALTVGSFVLVRTNSDLGTRHRHGARRLGDRSNRRAPRFFSPPHHGAGQHQ